MRQSQASNKCSEQRLALGDLTVVADIPTNGRTGKLSVRVASGYRGAKNNFLGLHKDKSRTETEKHTQHCDRVN